MIIELDGSQHYEEVGVLNDEKRTEYLNQLGLCVLRFTNLDIERNFNGVCELIDNEVKKRL